MTIDDLLEKSAAELEKLTDDELKAFFAPYLKYTRPELAEKPINSKKPIDYGKSEKQAKKDKTNEILASLGLDIKL